MRNPDRLPDEALDSLLDGSPSEEAVGTPLAAYLEAVRHDAVGTDPQPSDELGVVLAEGLDPAEIEVGVQATAAASGITAWRRRGRLAVRALVTKFAALGLLTKAAAAGAAVTVAASGAGAAGVLPPPAQSTFNEVIGREAPPEDTGAESDEDDETGETGGSAPDTPADTSSTAPLDSDLSDDATGASEGDPGVDGSDVARDASDGRSDVSDDPPDRPEDVPEEPPAEDAPDGTPAEDVVEDTPGEDARPDSDEADEDGQDAAGNDEVDPRPDDPAQSPWDAERPPR